MTVLSADAQQDWNFSNSYTNDENGAEDFLSSKFGRVSTNPAESINEARALIQCPTRLDFHEWLYKRRKLSHVWILIQPVGSTRFIKAPEPTVDQRQPFCAVCTHTTKMWIH